MTKDDIIRMARKAGAVFPSVGIWHRFDSPEALERFAALVAAAEREACANLCESHVRYPSRLYFADAIRARGNK